MAVSEPPLPGSALHESVNANGSQSAKAFIKM
jgi:hypothetical protein